MLQKLLKEETEEVPPTTGRSTPSTTVTPNSGAHWWLAMSCAGSLTPTPTPVPISQGYYVVTGYMTGPGLALADHQPRPTVIRLFVEYLDLLFGEGRAQVPPCGAHPWQCRDARVRSDGMVLAPAQG